MKKFIITVAAIMALAIPAAASAHHNPTPYVQPTAQFCVDSQTVTATGVLAIDVRNTEAFFGGYFTFQFTPPYLVWNTVVTGACVVTPPLVVTPRTPDYIYLCTPSGALGDWAKSDVAALVADGYTVADAVAGNVDNGTNVGAYNLTCNATGSPTGEYVGTGGTVFGADYGPAREEFGFYPVLA